MTGTDSRTLMLALRGWLEGESRDSEEMRTRRLVERVYAKALAGHFGYFRLLLDMVDGPIRLSQEDEPTGEADSVLVVADDRREAGAAKAA